VTAQDAEQQERFERTARWLLSESIGLNDIEPGEYHDRKAQEIMRRCEALKKEIARWSNEPDAID